MRYVFLLEWLDKSNQIVPLVIYLIEHQKDHDSNHMAQGSNLHNFSAQEPSLTRTQKINNSKQFEIMTTLCGTLSKVTSFLVRNYIINSGALFFRIYMAYYIQKKENIYGIVMHGCKPLTLSDHTKMGIASVLVARWSFNYIHHKNFIS